MNRPASANAQNTQMGLDLADLFGRLYLDHEDLRCLVFTGAGDKFFSAGGDLKERNNMSGRDWERQHAVFEQVVMRLMDCPVPTIAAVNGIAYAGGCELALACDLIYAARTARFALTEVTLGIMPGTCGTQNLLRACGTRRAKEIILTGKPFSAEDALAWNIANRLCEPRSLLREAVETADVIAGNAPLATRQAKKAINAGAQADLRTGYAIELEAYNRLVVTEDRLEGIRAYNEKRRPQFKGK
jgi:enoyl-CoA hydratase/carnithine racemase